MSTFVFKWKRKFLWHSTEISGFEWVKDMDRMVLFYEDGSIYEIPKWNECHCLLGHDFYIWKLKKAESEAGQKIPTKVVD
jgi:hypothetical protein